MKAVKLATLACLALPAIASADYTIQDGKNVMKIGGQLRSEFATGLNQDSTTSNKAQRYSQVTVNTANLHFAGAINEKLVYKMRLKLAPQTTGAEETNLSGEKVHNTYNMIDYAYAGYQFMPQLTVAIGKVAWGAGFDNQSSAMSPLTFAQDADVFLGSGSTNGIIGYGAITENIDWTFTAANSFGSQSNTNANRSMDYVVTLAHHTKDAADAEGYNAGGDFKSYVAVDYAQVNRDQTTSGKENRKIFAAAGFFSMQNAIVHAGATSESTAGRKDDVWTLGAGYLFDKTWRPAVTYTSVNSENVMGVKGRHGIAAVNLTQFHDDNKWRNYVEFSTIQKSDEAKAAAVGKKETPWKVSVGLTVNL